MEQYADMGLMGMSASITVLLKLASLIIWALLVEGLLVWMDRREGGGFPVWSKEVSDENQSAPQAVRGLYYIVRLAAVYIGAALILSA